MFCLFNNYDFLFYLVNKKSYLKEIFQKALECIYLRSYLTLIRKDNKYWSFNNKLNKKVTL